MKRQFFALLAAVAAVAIFCSATPNAPATSNRPLVIRFVEFKKCIEVSKLGIEEKANFEAMKKKIETTFEEKQKEYTALTSKLNDPDYLDSLSPEAETELKRKFRALNQEMAEMESHFSQTLAQINFKVIQKMTESVNKASKTIAQRDKIDYILNEESCFYQSGDLDITDSVVKEMDKQYEADKKGA